MVIAIVVVAAGAVLAPRQPTCTAKAITLNLHCVIQRRVTAGVVLGCGGNREPSLAVTILANTEIGWSPIALPRAIRAPYTSFLHGYTLVVDVVLCRGEVTVVLEIRRCVRASQRVLASRLSVEWNSLTLSA